MNLDEPEKPELPGPEKKRPLFGGPPSHWLIAGLLVTNAILAVAVVRPRERTTGYQHRIEAIGRASLHTKLNWLGSHGWELVDVTPVKGDRTRVWATLRRRGSSPVSPSAVAPEKKGKGGVPLYYE